MPAVILWSFAIIVSRYKRPAKGNGPAGTDTIITYWLPARPSDVLTRAAPPQRCL